MTAVDRPTAIVYSISASSIGSQQNFQVDAVLMDVARVVGLVDRPSSHASERWTSSGTYDEIGTPRATIDDDTVTRDPALGRHLRSTVKGRGGTATR